MINDCSPQLCQGSVFELVKHRQATEGPRLATASALLLLLDELDDTLVLERGAAFVERPLTSDVRFDFGIYLLHVNAREDFRFTCVELQRPTGVINIPHVLISCAVDRFLGVEALNMR
ncbi:hypothetical protein PHYPSEUDO_008603 [Phytophthora pseudosyringae]|uniref:Uncharacterized protein n=1 Tax=Phytophthora pseudosyringae TaxID=221518 RepID=A0A8T1WEY5_9STRA|nr:hypothetical protein PHYPSEUDO_008603 [Phytophthora pseudosyringae]